MENIIIIISISIIVFLISREFFCWYWKVNNIVTLLSDINEKLQKLIDTTNTIGSAENCKQAYTDKVIISEESAKKYQEEKDKSQQNR